MPGFMLNYLLTVRGARMGRAATVQEVKMSKGEKYLAIVREAKWTAAALAALIIFWLFAGFGLANADIRLLGVPLWAITSSVGVWFMAIALVLLLLKLVFRDMPLEDDEDKAGGKRG